MNIRFGVAGAVFLACLMSVTAHAQWRVTATAGDRQVTLSWSNVAQATAYDVQHAGVAGGPYADLASGLTSNLYTHSGLANGSTNYYVVTAYTPTGNVTSAETNGRPWVLVRMRAINCGGASVGDYGADVDYVGGVSISTTSAINRTAVADPAPEAVYQSGREGYSEYYFYPFHPGRRYRIRFHFAEIVYSTANNRDFHISTNSSGSWANWITWRDIFNDFAGTSNKAAVQTMAFLAPASSYKLQLKFEGSRPLVSGIEVFAMNGPLPTVLAMPRDGNIILDLSSSIDCQEFDVARSLVPGGPYETLEAGFTGSMWTDRAVTNGVTYYYRITGRSNWGEAEAPELAVTPGVLCYAININGVNLGRFIAENASYTQVGGTAANTGTIPVIPVGTPDPAENVALYQRYRTGAQTNVFAGLLPGERYLVRFHLNEFAKTAAGTRVFHVDVNADRVLTNLDVFASAGGKDRALVREAVCTADGEGKLTVKYLAVTDQPAVCGIEIRQQSGVMTPPPPGGFTAANLAWLAALNWNNPARDLAYSVWRSTADGGPYETVASNLYGSSYLDDEVVDGQTYYYKVAAEVGGSAVAGAASAQAATAVTAGTNIAGLHVQYYGGYAGIDAAETLAAAGGVSVIQTNWSGRDIGAPAVGDRNAKVVWNGRIALNRNALYTFHAKARGGFRLWVTNQCVINNWAVPGTGDYVSGSITVGALTGLYPVRAEFYNLEGNAEAALEWEAPLAGLPREVVPADYLRPVVLGDPSPWIFRDVAMGGLPGFGEAVAAVPGRIGLWGAGTKGVTNHMFACQKVTGPFELTARVAAYFNEGRYSGTWFERMGLVVRSSLTSTNGFVYGIVHNTEGGNNTRLMYKDNLAAGGVMTETDIVYGRGIPMYLRMTRAKIDGQYVIRTAWSSNNITWVTNATASTPTNVPAVYAGMSLATPDSVLLYGYFDSIVLRELRQAPGGALIMLR